MDEQIVACSGYKRNAHGIVIHASGCPNPAYLFAASVKVTHGISDECNDAYRRSEGLEPRERKPFPRAVTAALALLLLSTSSWAEDARILKFRGYVIAWSAQMRMPPPPVYVATTVTGKPCESTHDGYASFIRCDQSKLRGQDLRRLALHELAHIYLGHTERQAWTTNGRWIFAGPPDDIHGEAFKTLMRETQEKAKAAAEAARPKKKKSAILGILKAAAIIVLVV